MNEIGISEYRGNGIIGIPEQSMNVGQRCKKGIVHLAQTARAVLREVFDEAPYERYLARTCSDRSKESYRSFLNERQAAMARKPRCC